jgi:GTP-binding protein
VARPEVITKEINGEVHEPYEQLTIDVDSAYQGKVMELIGMRGGDLKNMEPDNTGRVRLDYMIPARGLIGIQNEFLTLTSGTGIMHHVFDHYGARKNIELAGRHNGVLISNAAGKASAYALFNLQERGKMLIEPQTEVYEGMVVGIHSRDNDLVVNVTKEKQLTNIRAAGKDDALLLTPPILFSLEQALEFIDDDELVELTPNYLRIRKKFLKEHERKRSSKN